MRTPAALRQHNSSSALLVPALLSLQQLAVGGDLDVQGHLDVQQVLVVTQKQSNLLLGDLQIQLETPYPHLWLGDEMRRIGFTAGPHRTA